MRRGIVCGVYVLLAAACGDRAEPEKRAAEARPGPTRPQPALRIDRHAVGGLTAATPQRADAIASALPGFRVAKTAWPAHVDPGPYESFCLFRGARIAIFLQHSIATWDLWDFAGHLVPGEHELAVGSTHAEVTAALGELRCDAGGSVPAAPACVMVSDASPFRAWRRLVRCTADSSEGVEYWFDDPDARDGGGDGGVGWVSVPGRRRVVLVRTFVSRPGTQ